MGELITDRGVLAGLVVALLVTVLAPRVAVGRSGGRWPAGAVAALAVAGSLLVAGVSGQSLTWADADAPSALGAVSLVVAVAAVVVIFVGAGGQTRVTADATAVLALAAVGLLASVPETDLLRLTVGPLLIAAAGARMGWLAPLGPIGAGLVATVLAWLSLVGGTPRPASIFGAAACLLAVWVAMAPGGVERAPTWWRIVLGALVVAGTAWAGRRSSISAATIQAVAVLAAGLAWGYVVSRRSASVAS